MEIVIKPIMKNHLREAHSIYNYYIHNSYSNFEEKQISFVNFTKNYKSIKLSKLPYLVALNDKKVVGIAYLNRFREKSGYRYSYENTIYVHNRFIKKGIGFKLLKKLISFSRKNKNIKKIVAVIGGIDNEGSLKIHQKLGFQRSGILKKIGFKNRRWIDAILLLKEL